MIYIYDMTTDEYQLSFKRYGVKFKLENRVNISNRVYYLYTAKGHDKLMVVPQFAQMYFEAKAKFDSIDNKKTYKEFIYWLRRSISDDYQVEISKIGSGNDDADIVYDLAVLYKDIQIFFTVSMNGVQMREEFVIFKNNIFGNGQVVSMSKTEDD